MQFPFLAVGALVFGAIWAKYSWGRFWSFDPKETWSLITWLLYSAYLHSRFIFMDKKYISIYIFIGAFLAMLFTFFGVNFLIPGLHSYN